MGLLGKLLAGLALLLLPAPAAAQNLPAKPIKLIVPFPRRRALPIAALKT